MSQEGLPPKRSNAWRFPSSPDPARRVDHHEMTALAEKLEPQIEARFLRAAERMRSSVDLEKLTLALANGNEAAALRATLTTKRLQEVMGPLETTIKENLVRGGKLGARQLKQMSKDLS
jgi:hypothetical protein